ncbi:branched-chain amino acid ABC transporter permease [Natrarchaeobaculum sulfurireducens]|uniref:ABC-type branched-chain amino acid transport system, permease component n=1 Tax=Natrarchaeobaculum sulfurireducens TaxID=2044521 RepID=A0A346PMW7_9EURY|nr:branched-chain amino acid ABC transporter permease [Natrarchaeobaculum sulfurireducens]AXR79064.1 ABC-type branched-chain amino acid transport system, permease component [Natrarchaeobaculum sulfurireducens]AXR80862.1 Branched-chain amino acid transport ATP-binding protein LivG [Natrarchaeobaculum sulfurireducens]
MSSDTQTGGSLESVADGYNDRFGHLFGELNGPQFALLIGSLVVLLAAPVWTSLLGAGGLLRTLALASIWAILAMAWDIQSGYTGYISFGHAVLSGGAAYTTAMLVAHVNPDLPFLVTAPISVFAALVIGLVIAIPSLRLRGPYFSLVTFVAGLIFYQLTYAFSGYTGGELGQRVGRIEFELAGAQVTTFDPVTRYYVMLVPMLVIAVALLYVARSNVGMILIAIRENEEAVAAAGIDTTKFKIWSFVLSSIPMGVGGVLLAHFYGSVNPLNFLLVDRSIEIIAMAVVGGMSSILGPIGGAFLVIVLREEVLGVFGVTGRWVALWTVVLLVLVFARDGLFRKLWHILGDRGRADGGDDE